MKKKKTCFVKLVLCVLTAAIAFCGFKITDFEYSEEEAELYRIDIEQVTPDSGITTGHVIAYGHYIKLPYKIEITDTLLLINDVQIFPRFKPPKAKKVKSDTFIPKSENAIALANIRATFHRIRKVYDKGTTYEMIVKYIENLEVVFWVRAKAYEGVIIAKIYFTDGTSVVGNYPYISEPEPIPQTEEEILKAHLEFLKEEKERISDNLDNLKGLIIYSYKGEFYSAGRKIYKISSVLANGEYSIDEKGKALLNILSLIEVREIIYNYIPEEWEKLEKKKSE